MEGITVSWAAIVAAALALLNGLILLVAGAGAKYLRDMRQGIEGVQKEMARMNSRTAKLETWAEDHEKLDDERHQRNLDTHGKLRDAIDGLRGFGRGGAPAGG